MYCPKCGQQQISENTRFCSRCGIPISGLAEWLEGRGGISRREENTPIVLTSPRRKRIRRGAKLMFWSVVLMPVFLILSLIVDEPIPLFIPFAIFLIGLSLMLYARIFSEEMSNVGSQDTRPSSLGAMFRSSALPSASTSMANRADWQQVRTSELIEPPSVAEHTTKLLD